ncbi:MAG: hypothetical protein ACM31C_24710 [Acidobacteriota bacterium]
MRVMHIALLALLASCAVNSEPEDGANDTFLSDGKADGGIQEGSPEAAGVLRVANEVDYATLHGTVKLSSRAAHNIVAARPFTTLKQLDDVPYVGPIALAHMLAYAEAQGWVTSPPPTTDPFDPASCTGAPITQQQALAYFAPAATEAAIAPYHVSIRSRACNQLTGCAGWQPASWRLNSWAGAISEAPVDGMLDFQLASGTVELSPRADFCNPNESISTCASVSAASQSCSAPSLPISTTNACGGSAPAQLGTSAITLAGIVTDHCTRLAAHAADAPDANGSYTEYDAVVLATYGSSACQPLTCAGAGKNCGTMPDGCGGTLDCSSCGSGASCQQNVCVPLPCGGTCGPSQVCCYDPLEGHDDCFDACS